MSDQLFLSESEALSARRSRDRAIIMRRWREKVRAISRAEARDAKRRREDPICSYLARLALASITEA